MEHHSNVSNSDEQEKQIDTAWKEPIICTTMIQFLYTLFSQKNKSIRRFHQLKNSVIIVDEAQALPVQTIHTFNLMMNFLCYVCHATIILCTATQPQLASGNIKERFYIQRLRIWSRECVIFFSVFSVRTSLLK